MEVQAAQLVPWLPPFDEHAVKDHQQQTGRRCVLVSQLVPQFRVIRARHLLDKGSTPREEDVRKASVGSP